MVLFFKLYAQYGRSWVSRDVLAGAYRLMPTQYGRLLLSGDELYSDERDDLRRAELASLIRFLTRPPNNALRVSLHGRKGSEGLAYQGERTFRVDVARLCTMLLPPMSAEYVSMFQQKCWGRKNLELLYDSLGFAELQESLGAQAMVEKNDKGDVVRQVIAELHLAAHGSLAVSVESLAEARKHGMPLICMASSVPISGEGVQLLPGGRVQYEVESKHEAARSLKAGSVDSLLRKVTDLAPPPPANRVLQPFAMELSRIALRRIAFELVYLRSSFYMGKVRRVASQYGFPTLEQLERWGFH